MVGRNPVRLREVVFTLSRDEVNVMSGLFKDIPHKAAHWVQKLRDPLLFGFAPLYAIGWYCADYKEQEKLHHRF